MSGAMEDVAAAITELIARLDRARAGCITAAAAAVRASDQFRSSVGTSRDPHAVAMIQRTGLAAQRLHEGDQVLSEAVRAIQEYAARLGVDVTGVVQSSDQSPMSAPPSSSMVPHGTKVVGVMTSPVAAAW